MRARAFLAMTGIISVLTCPAWAKDAGDAGKPEKLICKRAETTGSRLPGKRICQTAEEWRREHEQARAITEDLQHMGSGPRPRNGE